MQTHTTKMENSVKGAGVGVGMLGGRDGCWFLDVLVMNFLVSRFLGCLVAKFQSSNHLVFPNCDFMFSERD